MLEAQNAPAALPPVLFKTALQAGLTLVAGKSVAGLVSSQTIALVEGGINQ